MPKHLIGIVDLTKEEILSILELGKIYKEKLIKNKNTISKNLRDRIVVNLFFEPSTRTRMSFEIAAELLGAKVINFSEQASSVQKGETKIDTLKTIEAMKTDFVVVRSNISGFPKLLAREITNTIVINGGDGSHEHPSQALLDTLTISEHFSDLSKVRLSIVGDILFSRVARSNIFLFRKLGNENVKVYGPSTLVPSGIEKLGVTVAKNLDEVFESSDVVMLLRIQTERQNFAYIPSFREYREFWGITQDKMVKYKGKKIFIMHPGPVNRGIEIDHDIVYCSNSLILDQVTSGVAVRMAIFTYFLNVNSTS